ncbi:hypothetical protein [Rhizobium leguminosarum]|uniref:hypothetical protein n=1 Tax=Rhizobium leguminosarum TaxID=384 RepID=UPI001C91CCE4|nr:hypothetical protein [Rhizobium leguminosarum]MBY2910023.1 hypothetical protein [Rhizobium leguminosarum]
MTKPGFTTFAAMFLFITASQAICVETGPYKLLPDRQAKALRAAVENGRKLPVYDRSFVTWTAIHLIPPECNLVDSSDRERIKVIVQTSFYGAQFEQTVDATAAQLDPAMLKTVKSACDTREGGDLLQLIVKALVTENANSATDWNDNIFKPKKQPYGQKW